MLKYQHVLVHTCQRSVVGVETDQIVVVVVTRRSVIVALVDDLAPLPGFEPGLSAPQAEVIS